MYTTWMGIDPGLHGAVAVQYSNQATQIGVMPLKDGQLDLEVLSRMIDRMLYLDVSVGHRPTLVYVEQVGSMPGQGVSSTFKFGFVTGAVHGILAAKGLTIHLVHPVRWKNRVLAGTTKDKLAAIAYCQEHFPKVNLLATPRSRKPHDGIADALCISEYAKSFHSENTKHKQNGKHLSKPV